MQGKYCHHDTLYWTECHRCNDLTLSNYFLQSIQSPVLFSVDMVSFHHLAKFCANIDPFGLLSKMTHFYLHEPSSDSVKEQAMQVLMLYYCMTKLKNFSSIKNNIETTPVILDTGTLNGLTPFFSNFITYENKMETSLSTFRLFNKLVMLLLLAWFYKSTHYEMVLVPCQCFHMPETGIHLNSP